MMTAQVVLYVLAAIIAAGIAFLIWTLIHLIGESHRPAGPAAQPADEIRWRR
jgi:hypothetical protein